MTEDPYVLCIASGIGAFGRAGVRDYYAQQFLPYIPPDFELRSVSQVLGHSYLVEEFVLRFTHSMPMDWMLPNVPVTGRRVEVAAAAIIRFRGSKIAHEHIYWDQATALSQLGVLDHPAARAGVASAAQLLFLSEGLGVC